MKLAIELNTDSQVINEDSLILSFIGLSLDDKKKALKSLDVKPKAIVKEQKIQEQKTIEEMVSTPFPKEPSFVPSYSRIELAEKYGVNTDFINRLQKGAYGLSNVIIKVTKEGRHPKYCDKNMDIKMNAAKMQYTPYKKKHVFGD